MSFKTQAEIYQALLDGKKITGVLLENIQYLHLNDGFLKSNEGNAYTMYHFDKPENWSIYEEPKGKKQVWQWRHKNFTGTFWNVDAELMTERDAKRIYAAMFRYEKHAGPFEVEE